MTDTTSTITSAAPETARDLCTRLADAGWQASTIDLAVRATAPARHEWRVAQTLRAVTTAILGEPTEIAKLSADTMHDAIVLLLLDAHGVGGTLGCTGEATRRMPWAQGLGSGRSHARDGEAWKAAAREAVAQLRCRLVEIARGAMWGELELWGELRLVPVGGRWWLMSAESQGTPAESQSALAGAGIEGTITDPGDIVDPGDIGFCITGVAEWSAAYAGHHIVRECQAGRTPGTEWADMHHACHLATLLYNTDAARACPTGDSQ